MNNSVLPQFLVCESWKWVAVQDLDEAAMVYSECAEMEITKLDIDIIKKQINGKPCQHLHFL